MAAPPQGMELDVEVMKRLAEGGKIENTLAFARGLGADHQALVGVLSSLTTDAYVEKSGPLKESVFRLTAQGEEFVAEGMPEFRVLQLVEQKPMKKDELAAAYKHADIGCKIGMKEKILKMDSGAFIPSDKAKDWNNPALGDLLKIKNREGSVSDLEALTKKMATRKLAEKQVLAYFEVGRGAAFSCDEGFLKEKRWRVKKPADFDARALQEMWRTGKVLDLKACNIKALGRRPDSGNLHPLMKLRQQYREIFLELGFQEMDTARFVDSSFWNFDTLFVPQQHPARDEQDTFFISDPEFTTDHPKEFVEATHRVHTTGDYGSTGYMGKWCEKEAQRNVLRTHTTAISSYALYEIGQEYQRTGKLRTGAFFSIDRVFRNEAMDKSHLCEFHQMEGFVLDYGLSLGNMMSLLGSFFERVGFKRENLKFKAAYNPYTEPSMEVHTVLPSGKVMEVGNSGVFRPEMLRPMGLPEDVTAIAWGLGLERVAMRHYKLDSVQELFGHKIDLKFVKNAVAPRV